MNVVPAPMEVRECRRCFWSIPDTKTGRLLCREAHVNIPPGAALAMAAFVAGDTSTLRSCLYERGLKRGVCGRTGKLFTPRPDDPSGIPTLAPVDRLDV